MQVSKSEELKYVLQVYAQQTTFGDKKYDHCRLIEVDGPKTSRANGCVANKCSMMSTIRQLPSAEVSSVQNSSHVNCGSPISGRCSFRNPPTPVWCVWSSRLHLRIGSFGFTAVPSRACLLGSPSLGSSSACVVLSHRFCKSNLCD